MATVFTPPTNYYDVPVEGDPVAHRIDQLADVTIFLAGSIDMGKAELWQDRVITELQDQHDVVIFNPRRDDWDSSWEQDISNPNFSEQVRWEMTHLINHTDIALFYFDPNGPAPITLLELGLVAPSHEDVIVCCPPGYWRRGNVQIVCDMFNIPLFDTFEEMMICVKTRISEIGLPLARPDNVTKIAGIVTRV